jgi:hypothetical protein
LHAGFWLNWYILCIILIPTLSFDKHVYETSKFYHLRKTFLILGMLIENKCNDKYKQFEDIKGVIRNCKLRKDRQYNTIQCRTSIGVSIYGRMRKEKN